MNTMPETLEAAWLTFQRRLDVVQRNLEQLSRAAHGPQPPHQPRNPAVLAIEALIDELTAGHCLSVDFQHNLDDRELPPTLERALLGTVRECLTNVYRHALTTSARVEVTRERNTLRIAVEDWGVGFEPVRHHRHGLGLQCIWTRAALLGGRAAIRSNPGHGTLVVVELPIPTIVARDTTSILGN